VLAKLPPPSQAPDLAQAAVPAVERLAALKGVTVQAPPLDAGSGGDWRDRIVIALGGLAIVLLVAAGFVWRRRAAAAHR
jgi:uncharacterized iron-regulated membrane protein